MAQNSEEMWGLSKKMETEDKDQLPFLNVLLSKQSASDHQGSFINSVYRKNTYTGLLTNNFSFTPFKYKLGLLKLS